MQGHQHKRRMIRIPALFAACAAAIVLTATLASAATTGTIASGTTWTDNNGNR